MGKIRVLVVDDSVVARRLISEVLSGDPMLEVVATAVHGRNCLAKIPLVNPDCIILDIDMPEMDGLTALKELRKSYPRLPVIMFSTLTERGATASLEALFLGANDYVSKPSKTSSTAAAVQSVRDELIPKIKAFCSRSISAEKVVSSKPLPPLPGTPVPSKGDKQRVDVVAIGVSTGGPVALAALMPVFPPDFPVPVLIVQHMPPLFTRLLSERLSSASSLKVSEGASGVTVHPGRAWVAPGDYHMLVIRHADTVQLQSVQGPPENSCRPAVDVLFRSVARVYGPNTLAVVMTGMGNDGFKGCEEIHRVGGSIIVQDEKTSVVWGMPGVVARAGLAEKVLPLNELGQEILRRVREGMSAIFKIDKHGLGGDGLGAYKKML